MSKKMIIQQKFCEDYAEKYLCFVKSSVSVHHARCEVCSVDTELGDSLLKKCKQATYTSLK